MSRHAWLWLGLGLVACRPTVTIGADGEDITIDTECSSTLATVSCPPSNSWGPPSSFSSPLELRARLLGQWAFCGGERRYAGRGPIRGFYAGSGVEFFDEGGALRYAFLEGLGPYTRRTGTFNEGTVRLEVGNGQAQAVLVALDGLEAPWKVEIFEGRQVLRNSGFEVWNFLKVP